MNNLTKLFIFALLITTSTLAYSSVPSAPSYTSASASSTSVSINWGYVSAATYYKLQYQDGNGGWNTSGGQYTGTSKSWSNISVSNRSYRMAACNSSGCSDWSSASGSVSTGPEEPSVPRNVSASASGSSVTLSWRASSDASYYRIKYRDGAGSWIYVNSKYYSTSKTWTNIAVTNRSYIVKACNTSGCSDYSSASNLVSSGFPPAKPNNTSVSSSGTSLTVSWANVGEAKYYKLQYRDGSGSWKNAGSTYTGNSVTWPSIVVTNRSYQMSACNDYGCSGYSTPSSAITVKPKPAKPSTPSVSQNGTTNTLSWSAVSHAEYYRVEVKYNSNSWSDQGQTSSRSKTWSNLNPGSRVYRIRACNSSICSDYSSQSNAIVTNAPPTANAGNTIVFMEGHANRGLNGSGQDSDGSIVSYLWEQVSGPAVNSWTNKNSAKTIFSTPQVSKDEVLVFRLTVTDNDGATGSDTVTVKINDRPSGTITTPSADFKYKSSDTINVVFSNISDASNQITSAKTFIRFYQDNRWQTAHGWRNMSLNSSKTQATYNWGSPASLNLKSNIRYVLITQAIDNGGGGGWGWYSSKNFYVNAKPSISGTPSTSGTANTTYNFLPSVNDSDDSNFTFSIQNKPSWASFNTSTGKLSGTPGAADVKTFNNIKISVSDGTESTTLPAFSIAVKKPVPVTMIAPVASVAADDITLNWTAVDFAEYYQLQYKNSSVSWTNSNSTYHGASQIWRDLSPVSSHSYRMRACNSTGCATTWSPASNAVTIKPKPATPAQPNVTLDGTTNTLSWTSVTNAEYYRVEVKYNSNNWSDQGTVTTLSKQWLDLNPGSRVYRIKACNSTACSEYSPVSSALVTNAPPTANAGPDLNSLEWYRNLALNGSGSDSDGTIVSYSWEQISGTSVAAWADQNKAVAKVKTPNISDDETIVFKLTVTDDKGATASDTVSVFLNDRPDLDFTFPASTLKYPSNGVAEISVSNIRDTRNQIVKAETFIRKNHEGDYTLKHAWRNMTLNNGKTQATYNWGNVANLGLEPNIRYQFIARARDNGAAAGAGWYRGRYFYVNAKPMISGNSNISAEANSLFTFTPSVTDIDDSSFTYSIQNKPNWANFDTSTGTLSGTPSNSEVKSFNDIVIAVNDGTESTSLTIGITVTPSKPSSMQAPTVSLVGNDVTLSWLNVEHTEYYELEYRDGTSTWTKSNGVYTGTSHIWQDLSPVTNRSYRMRPCNEKGCAEQWSEPSNAFTIEVKPDKPATPTASVTGQDVSLTWAPTQRATYYQLQFKDGTGDWVPVAAQYQDSTLQWADLERVIDRKYKIRACNESGCSLYSEESNAISVLIRPSTPVATLTGEQSIEVTWGNLPKNTEHVFIYTSYNDRDWVNVTSSPKRVGMELDRAVFTNLEPGTRKYKVVACAAGFACGDETDESNVIEIINTKKILSVTTTLMGKASR